MKFCFLKNVNIINENEIWYKLNLDLILLVTLDGSPKCCKKKK